MNSSQTTMLPSCRTGLLILTAPINQLVKRISPILSHAGNCVRETLYVQLQPGLDQEREPYRPRLLPVTLDVCSTITAIYAQSALLDERDVRILLHNFSNRSGTLPQPRTLPREVGLVLTDCSSQGMLQVLLQSWFTFPCSQGQFQKKV